MMHTVAFFWHFVFIYYYIKAYKNKYQTELRIYASFNYKQQK